MQRLRTRPQTLSGPVTLLGLMWLRGRFISWVPVTNADDGTANGESFLGWLISWWVTQVFTIFLKSKKTIAVFLFFLKTVTTELNTILVTSKTKLIAKKQAIVGT